MPRMTETALNLRFVVQKAERLLAALETGEDELGHTVPHAIMALAAAIELAKDASPAGRYVLVPRTENMRVARALEIAIRSAETWHRVADENATKLREIHDAAGSHQPYNEFSHRILALSHEKERKQNAAQSDYLAQMADPNWAPMGGLSTPSTTEEEG